MCMHACVGWFRQTHAACSLDRVGLGLESARACKQSALIIPKVFSSFHSINDTRIHVRGWWLSLKTKDEKKEESSVETLWKVWSSIWGVF